MPAERTTSDEDILAYSVREAPKPYAVKVVLVDYDPRWPQWYEEEATRIRAALGSGVVRIEHAGSTSVPGLAAKPIIDMMVAVRDSSNEDAYAPALEAAGYPLVIREPEFHEHRAFATRIDKGHARDVNVHVYTAGCAEYDRVLAFRDRLRSDEADRLLYQRAKQELAKKDWKFVQNYADAKTSVIHDIWTRAAEVDRACERY